MSAQNLEEKRPEVIKVIEAAGDVSDELDYAVNRYVMSERGYGLTACQPSLVELSNGKKAIHFNLDSTFIDADTDKVMGYGQLGTNKAFVGEVFIAYNPSNDDTKMLYITPLNEIDQKREVISANPEKYPPNVRPKGKY